MDDLAASAASGLRARMESLDLLANNIANANTGGFKADHEFYSLYVAPEASANADPVTLPVIERRWTDFSAGTVRNTGIPTDLALTGKGFFAVDSPSGPLYTRNGAFRLSAGKLITSEGYPVRLAGARPLDPERPFEVTADGTVRQGGADAGRLEIVDFADPASLEKQGGVYFRGGKPAPAGAEVHQGKLEDSNASAAQTAVRLVGVMRQFEMLQRAVSLGADMNRKAVEEVARV